VTGRLGDALGTLESVLGGLEEGDPVDELLKGRLEDVRDTLQEILSQVGEQAQEEGLPRQALPEGASSSAGESPGGASPKEE
jgi:hypothetical protein